LRLGEVAMRRIRAMGIRDKPIAPASPWQNGFAERLIGSIRRECVDHIVVWGEGHLRWILRAYARYTQRPFHQSLHLARTGRLYGLTQPALNCRLLNRTANGPCSRNQMNGAVTFYRKIAADAIT
jgi:transposase InsO family protein